MPLQKHLTLLVAVALAVALLSREFGAPRDVVRRRARGWLKELAESTSTLAASLEDAPSSPPAVVRARAQWCLAMCQPFKASAPDWPLVERHHSHNRSARAERRPLQGLVSVTRETKRPRARHTGQRVLARESRYIHTRAREGGGTGRGGTGTLYGGDGAPGRRPRGFTSGLHLDLRPPFESASSSSRTRCSSRSTSVGSWRMSPVVRRAGASMRSSAVAPDWE